MEDPTQEFSLRPEQFQKLIDERRAEYDREANLQEVARVPHEVTNPMELLLPEMWRHVMGELSPEDINNMSAAHGAFRDIIKEDERTKLISYIRNGDNDMEPPSESISEFHLEKLEEQWRLSDIASELSDPSSSNRQQHLTRSLKFSYRIMSYTELSKFKNAFEEIIANTNAILDNIGDRVYYFTCEFSFGIPPLKELLNQFSALLGWLRRMPNLKWFKFIGIITFEERDTGIVWPHGFGFEEDLIFPELPDLERMDLKLSMEPKDASLICRKFLSAYSHVKRVNMAGRKLSFGFDDGKIVTLRHFPILDVVFNTSALSPEVLSVDGCSYPEGDMRLLQSICDKKWDKLKWLDLKLDMQNESVFTVFRLLEKIPTLEKVSLTLENVSIGEDICYLRLPRLTHFGLNIKLKNFKWNDGYSFFFSFQFLLHVKKLNTLSWRCGLQRGEWELLYQNMRNEAHGLRRMIQFDGGRGDGTAFSLWSILPWLVNLTMELVEQIDERTELTITKKYMKGELIFSKEKLVDIPNEPAFGLVYPIPRK